MKKRIAIILLILTMLLTGMSYGLEPTETEPAEVEPIALEEVTDEAVSTDLVVTVQNVDGSPYVGDVFVRLKFSDDPQGGNTSYTTNAEGKLFITKDHLEDAFNDGVFLTCESLMVYPKDMTSANSVLKSISDYTGDEAAAVTLRLQSPTLTGLVVDGSGNPLGQSSVTLWLEDGSIPQDRAAASFITYNGVFSIAPVTTGFTGDVQMIASASSQSPTSDLESHYRSFPHDQKNIELIADSPMSNAGPANSNITLYNSGNGLVNGYVHYDIYTENGCSGSGQEVSNGLFTIENLGFTKGSQYTYLVITDAVGSDANTYKIDLHNLSEFSREDLGIHKLNVATLKGVVKDPIGVVDNAFVNIQFTSTDELLVWSKSDGSFEASPLTENFTGNVSISSNKNEKSTYVSDIPYNKQDVEVLFSESVANVDDPLLTATVKDVDDANYTGDVNCLLGIDGTIHSIPSNVVDGVLKLNLKNIQKGNEYNKLTIVPTDTTKANSVVVSLDGQDFDNAFTLVNPIALQVPTLKGTLKYEDGTPVVGSVAVKFTASEIIKVPTDSEGNFALATMVQGFSDDVELFGFNIDMTKASAPMTVSLTDQNVTLVADITPVDTSNIDRIELEFKDGDTVLTGSKVLDGTSYGVFLPEKTTSTMVLKAYDADNNLLDLTGQPIQIQDLRGFGKDPIFNSLTQEIQVFDVSGGYGDTFRGNVVIGNYQEEITVYVYKGKLGLLKVTNPAGDDATGYMAYEIAYKLSGGGNTGSSSNGQVYNGFLPIPIQADNVGVDYGYVIVSPEEKINGVAYANSQFTDITIKMNTSDDIIDLGTIKLQEPVVTVTAIDVTDQSWSESVAEINCDYISDKIDIYNTRMSLSNIDGKFYFASLGSDFSDEFDTVISDRGMEGSNNPYKFILNISTDSDMTIKSPVIIPSIVGDLLLPNGDIVPAMHGRDTTVYVREVNGNQRESSQNNDGNYHIINLVEGTEYEIYVYFDMGDFNDKKITDSIPLIFTYDKTIGEHKAIDKYGNEVTYTVDDKGTMTLDLTATTPVLKGHVYMGGESVKGVDVSVIDSYGNTVARGYAHNATTPGVEGTDNGVYLVGGIAPLTGTYTVKVDDPTDTIDYTGFSQEVSFPVDSDDFVINLPEAKISGKLVVDSSDEAKYAGRYRRIYVNIFDEYGNYMTNGQVKPDGNFAMGQLEIGRYYAEAFVSPYSDLAEDYSSSDRILFTVTGEDKQAFDVLLKKKIASAIVINPDNQPVSESWVMIFDKDYNEVASVSTDDGGQFGIPLLPDGTYLMKALGKNGYVDSFESEFVISDGQYNGTGILFLNDPLFVGKVKADDANIVGANIFVFNDKKQFVGHTVSDDLGQYKLGGLNAGTYYLQAIPQNDITGFTQTGLIEVTVNASTQLIDLNLDSVDLIGTVTGPSNETITKGWVQLYFEDKVIASAKIDNGTFKFGNLEVGKTYEVKADGSDTPFYASDMKSVVASESVVLQLTTNASIVGNIIDGSDVVEGYEVYLYNASKEAIAAVRTNAFGEYSFSGLEAGSYSVVVPSLSGEAIEKLVDYTVDEINLNTIDIQ